MKVVSTLLALAVALTIVGKLAADDTAPAKPKHPAAAPSPFDVLKGLNLTDEQKAKVHDLKKEYGPKLKEAHQKVECILTADQKKAREEAMKEAKAAGKKRQEVWKAAEAAVKLTEDQKTQMKEAREGMHTLGKEIHEKINAILTPEQQEQLKKKLEKHKAK
jgi:Spy/CpxP family protein refolding chaperone